MLSIDCDPGSLPGLIQGELMLHLGICSKNGTRKTDAKSLHLQSAAFQIHSRKSQRGANILLVYLLALLWMVEAYSRI